ncbi:two-component sensor histidine kinase [Clostridium sp. 2-1]|uniref:HAMP domain-containing sensor histidine kinase n=1 Tax=Clostridium TaxID=1485 RepID=UPI000CDB92AE|nr:MULTISPECIES: HAMP domain-containing sensor histidine kinase [Clostridium]MBN7573347.1 HAMP domain-containing histidine kinase [Clostridium beijerinckii]MBN7578685.1 HAMP domain-containing histidine kinase [Clostridium beijerinckii]MBN7583120.1 HAMP domain-containing histidine kinase [Clostridium beijerinckii]MBO0519275.1 HAMP domain-containing histidine kinase [Clostridium beijerinckii]POO90875.1 two-component sensor histidine kinase [Clostridium sp. 2-1]
MKFSIFTRKISVELILSIIISVSFAFLLVYISSTFITIPYFLARDNAGEVIDYCIISFLISAIGIAAFLAIFLLLVNKKIKYIKYISEEVSKIANEQLGSTLKVRGNDELAELCKSINSMSLELKDKFEHERGIENTKTELITNVSHDLRTPLTAIIGYIDILKNEKYKSKEEEKEYLISTYNLSIKLKNLIDELFEYTKLSSRDITLKLEEVDLSSILIQMLGEYTPVLETKGLSIITDIAEEIPIKIDIEKIVRVFDNILNNAEKYSIKPSEIIIKAENISDYTHISISNKGRHIEQDKLNKMFEKFYRVDISRSSKIEGSGLGLAISQKIIALHNGEIWADCEDDMIRIHIKLPISN